MPWPFTRGGDKIAGYLRDLEARAHGNLQVNVGFLEGATYPNGASVPMVAALNEFGTKHIPPRPFMRNAVKNNSSGWAGTAATLLKNNDKDVKLVAELMGQVIAGQVRDSILSNTPPPNATSTARRKGHDQTLIDTGYMLTKVEYEVVTSS